MDDYVEKNPRLGVQDKRNLFQTLLAMTERLLYLNKFPANQPDFALSLQSPEVEAAWRLLNQKPHKQTLSPVASQQFVCNDTDFVLHLYPDEKESPDYQGYYWSSVFMHVNKALDVDNARRHQSAVKEWCRRQERLEDQCLRAAKVLKAIVHSCNTVGQYKRVSPDLLGYLPEKYRNALHDYQKKSPYPAITVEPEEIDTTLSSLAFAALQPEHYSEEEYTKRPKWGQYNYDLESFPRTVGYSSSDYRRLEL
jgi:hypothetical protein